MLLDVPRQYIGAYAHAHVDVSEFIEAALSGGTELELTRLTAPDRGGDRGAGEIGTRFAAWHDRDFGCSSPPRASV